MNNNNKFFRNKKKKLLARCFMWEYSPHIIPKEMIFEQLFCDNF